MKTLFLSFISVILIQNLAIAGVFLEQLPASQQIYRGRAPKKFEIKQMKEVGITSVLIFKNEVKTEVNDEITQLLQNGFNRNKIYHIPFLWKDIKSEALACEQVLTALDILVKVSSSSQDKILFHCTAGEDRTGLLAGLVSQLLAGNSSKEAFKTEMCEKGYAGGNKNKPTHVSKTVDRYLTPIYFKISKMIEEGQIDLHHLDKKICKQIEKREALSQLTCAEY